MLEISTLNELVERYLNGIDSQLSLPILEKGSSLDAYRLNCATRLGRAFTLFCRNHRHQNDFFMALRDYLLTCQTQLLLKNIAIPENNEYGLWLDPSDQSIHASYHLPDYVNDDLVQPAFLSTEQPTPIFHNKYDLHTDPLIYKLTGFSTFKSLAQKLAIYGALNTPDGYTTMVSLPTGGGKSLITQTLSYQQVGLTIIIVPTVSLAIDQVRVAKKTINTENPDEEIFYYSSGSDPSSIIHAIKRKAARMLFISPEALILNEAFVAAIDEANSARFLRNIIIDEAHIVVDWGADFRTDYQCLESWRNKLMMSNPQIRTILLSATYEQHCISILKDFFSVGDRWIEIRCDALRHEPRFSLVKCKSGTEKRHRIVELVRKCPHPMIIYTARPDDAKEIMQLLIDHGINNINTFTGLTTGLKRRELIDAWVDNQFEIMVATSAFGVGVDKSDIRTVLHTYIPQNPNAYYQELGRGGRDRLPCLSLMCVVKDDLDTSFDRIKKKVLTAEKIIGRWNSLYNDLSSKRMGNYVYISTAIKPKYAITDELNDSPASEADIRWNVYVLLFLRRYKMIRIAEVLPQRGKYVFVIEIINDVLRNNDQNLHKTIDAIRAQEWSYHVDAHQLMRKAIQNVRKQCWSEMFYETYDKVSEFCAGCDKHIKPIVGDSVDFTLKARIEQPIKLLDPDQMALMGKAGDTIILVSELAQSTAIGCLLKKRTTAIMIPTGFDATQLVYNSEILQNTFIFNREMLRDLYKKKAWYYLSGMITVLYQGSAREVFDQLSFVKQYLNQPTIRIVHVITENTYFEWLGKSFTDLVEGAVQTIESLRN